MGVELKNKSTDKVEAPQPVATTKKAKAPKAATEDVPKAKPIFNLLEALQLELDAHQAQKPCVELYDAQVHVDQLRRSLIAARL